MKKKIGIITLHLGFGGVELASINLANMLVGDYDVTIINMYDSEIAFRVDKRVRVITLSNLYPNKSDFKTALKTKNVFKIIKEGFKAVKILYLREKLVYDYLKNNQFDILISSRYLYTKLISKIKMNSIKIGVEHRHHNNDEKYIRKLMRACDKIDYLVTVSKELRDFYDGKTKAKCVHIPNYIEYYPHELEKTKKKQIIAVGRLSKEKGFDDLVDIFNEVSKKNDDWHLVIAGDGEEYKNLTERIKNYGLESKVKLPGFLKKDKLNQLYKESAIFLMTSHEESFGIVVIEAQSFGIPCITFSTATGVLELINEKCGIIIEDRNKEKMVEAVNDLIENKHKLVELSKESYKNAEKYTFEHVKKEWIKFLGSKEK